MRPNLRGGVTSPPLCRTTNERSELGTDGSKERRTTPSPGGPRGGTPEGRPGGGAESTGDPQDPEGEIRPIADLTPEAREYFDAIADFLDAKGLLEVVDVLALTMLSKNLTLWISISNQIHGVDDVVQTFDNGSTNISGLQTAKDRIEASVLKLCGRLGLSPLDRAKLFGAATAASSANSNKVKETTSTSSSPDLNGWKRYAEDVLAGRVVVGEYVRKHVETFVDEITDDSLRWIFDVQEATRFLEFIQTFTSHTRGEWAGRPFILSDWQSYLIANLFGWKERDSDLRRYRTATLFVARKSGKTQLAAAIAVAMAVLDDDAAGEYVFAATKRDQARIGFDEVRRMIAANPSLRRRFDVRRHDILGPRDGVMKPSPVTRTASTDSP